MKATSTAQWNERIARAATLLGERLDEPVSLAELAAAASISPFHFHRVWRALTGETVNQSRARLRIEAAKTMLSTNKSVTDAAMATGFGTPQSFARSFRQQTGQTPTQFASAPLADPPAPSPNSQIQIVLREPTKVVALRQIGGAYVALNALFQQVWDWADGEQLLDRIDGLYGIALDDPVSVDEDQLRYDACLALGDVAVPAPYHLVDLPSGRHACLRLTGSYDGLEAASQHLAGDWLASSSHEPADAPLYYHFLNDPESTDEAELMTDILLPLAPAGHQR